MSRIMVDTSVWIDILLDRPQFIFESKGAVMACLEEGDDVLVAATSLKDMFYFAEKSAGTDAAYRAVELVLEIAEPCSVDAVVCKNALKLERPDYEDGIVAACIQAEAADTVITRDVKAFADLGVKKFTPREFLESRGFDPVELA